MRPSTHSGESRHPRLPSLGRPRPRRGTEVEPILLIHIYSLSFYPRYSLPPSSTRTGLFKANFRETLRARARASSIVDRRSSIVDRRDRSTEMYGEISSRSGLMPYSDKRQSPPSNPPKVSPATRN